MVYVGRDTALHIALVAMAIALRAVEWECFPVTCYRCIKACILHFQGIANFGDNAEAGSKLPDVAIMADVGTDTALHIPPVAMSTAVMAAEGEAFPMT